MPSATDIVVYRVFSYAVDVDVQSQFGSWCTEDKFQSLACVVYFGVVLILISE